MYRFFSIKLFISILFLIVASTSVQAKNLKPFILADAVSGDSAQVIATVKTKLTDAGFEIIGEYSPYKGADLIIITNNDLKKNAATSEFGGYGAVQRIAITDREGNIRVSYTNPIYMAAVYRMKASLDSVASSLKSALGAQKSYGSEKGLSADDLSDYHYMFGMPYFDDPDMLADHGSYSKALIKVTAALAAKKAGVSKVFQLELPGKKQAIIGVAMTDGVTSDQFIMTEVDFKDIRSTAHLPYEILIDKDGKVYALSAKFRIAISFPDLSMTGDHSFMGIMDSPDAIKKVLQQAAGAKLEKASNSGGFGF